jgi:hypothetical protein
MLCRLPISVPSEMPCVRRIDALASSTDHNISSVWVGRSRTKFMKGSQPAIGLVAPGDRWCHPIGLTSKREWRSRLTPER